VFLLKLITATTWVLLIACHSAPKAQSLIVEGKKTENEINSSLEKKAVVEVQPTAISPEILYLLLTAETALQREQYSIALAAYLKVIQQTNDVKIIAKATKVALFLEDLATTEKMVLLWLAKDHNNTIARGIALTLALNKRNELDAIKHLNVLLKHYPADFNEILLKMQQALKSTADMAFSEKLLNKLAQQHPQQASIFLSQAILATRQQHFAHAERKVIQALTLQPEWEKAIELGAQLALHIGKQAFKNKQFNKALSAFNKVEYPPLALEASMAIISVLFAQKNFDEAETRLDELLETQPKQQLRIILMQAELQTRQENYQQAFDILTTALATAPLERKLLYSRALIADKLNDLTTLESDLGKILQQKPKDVPALNALGYTLVDKTTRYKEAEGYLKQALALQPEVAVIIDSYGWLKFKQGDLPTALTYLQQAYGKATGENEIVVHLAEVLWQLGKKFEARKLIDKEIKKSPDNNHLLEFKARILDQE
jgi:Flp pilus assembly protein TadD